MAGHVVMFIALNPALGGIVEIFAANPILLLFTVIGLGYLLGNITILGFKLGVAAVLIVGIALGAIDERLSLPDHIYVIGIVLFVYAIGLQAGTGFFSSFNRRGLRINLAAIVIFSAGAALAVALKGIMGLSAPSVASLSAARSPTRPPLPQQSRRSTT